MIINKITKHTILIILFTLILYWITLAPTVLWGDDAELQRLAILNTPQGGVRSYRLWISFAHLFTQLPFGDLAWRVNLSSAVFAAITIGVVFYIMCLLNLPIVIAWAGSLTLAISHTFWLHAVRAEVYSLFLLVLVIIVALLLKWHKSPTKTHLLYLGLLLIGLALATHLLIITFFPAIFYLIVATKKKNSNQIYMLSVCATMLGLFLYLFMNGGNGAQLNVMQMISNILKINVRPVVLWIGFFGYQFLFLMLIGIWGLIRYWVDDRILFWFLATAFWGNVIFALSFQVPDQYVFYLPSYLIFVFYIAKGFDDLYGRFTQRYNKHFVTTIMFLMIFLLVPIYRLTPVALNYFNLELLTVRTLPYRENNLFFFYPPKNNYYGARRFGKEVMATLPFDAAMLADWLPLQTLRYFQEIEDVQPDVLFADTYIDQGQLEWVIEQSQDHPVFLADDEQYYDIEDISASFEIIPYGIVFQLEKKEIK